MTALIGWVMVLGAAVLFGGLLTAPFWARSVEPADDAPWYDPDFDPDRIRDIRLDDWDEPNPLDD